MTLKRSADDEFANDQSHSFKLSRSQNGTLKPVPKSSSATPKKGDSDRPQMKQTILNFGQKAPINKPYSCAECGMTFVRSSQDERKAHSLYHDTALFGVKFKKYHVNWVVHESLCGLGLTVLKLSSWTVLSSGQRCLLSQVLSQVNQDLGATEIDEDLLQDLQIYLCLDAGKRVIGCLLAEKINHAFRIVPRERDDPLYSKIDLNYTSLSNECILGVCRVWCIRSRRKSGVAKCLLDSARRCFMFGTKISMDMLAFSQPTMLGRIFAEKYTCRKDFFVYKGM